MPLKGTTMNTLQHVCYSVKGNLEKSFTLFLNVPAYIQYVGVYGEVSNMVMATG